MVVVTTCAAAVALVGSFSKSTSNGIVSGWMKPWGPNPPGPVRLLGSIAPTTGTGMMGPGRLTGAPLAGGPDMFDGGLLAPRTPVPGAAHHSPRLRINGFCHRRDRARRQVDRLRLLLGPATAASRQEVKRVIRFVERHVVGILRLEVLLRKAKNGYRGGRIVLQLLRLSNECFKAK